MKLKRKRRGGRPRIINAKREKSGRIARHLREEAAYREALRARARMYGISEDQARDRNSGFVIGRMRLQKVLTKAQFAAATRYAECRYAYLRAISANPGFKEPLPITNGEGDYESFCRTAIARWNEMYEAIAEVCIEQRSPNPMVALDVFITRDIYLAHLEGDLKLALNRIDRLYAMAKAAA